MNDLKNHNYQTTGQTAAIVITIINVLNDSIKDLPDWLKGVTIVGILAIGLYFIYIKNSPKSESKK
jgi:hypothetical protein